jgi:hypothetical protein
VVNIPFQNQRDRFRAKICSTEISSTTLSTTTISPLILSQSPPQQWHKGKPKNPQTPTRRSLVATTRSTSTHPSHLLLPLLITNSQTRSLSKAWIPHNRTEETKTHCAEEVDEETYVWVDGVDGEESGGEGGTSGVAGGWEEG